jgi:hypothetical protein
LTWSVYDSRGRSFGNVTSSPSDAGQVLTIPDLSSGAYLFRCEEIGETVRLLVNTQ